MGRKVFVGNVPYGLKQDAFIAHFDKYDNYDRAYLVFNQDKPGENKGFGFVIFYDPESAQHCAGETHVISGQTLDCRVHDTKAEQYFVQHLSLDVTEDRLREYFDNLGEVQKLVMKTGFAFVTVKLQDDGSDLYTMDHSDLCPGVVIKKARQRRSDRGRGRGGGSWGGGRGFRGRGRGGYSDFGGGWGGGYRGHDGYRGRGRGRGHGGFGREARGTGYRPEGYGGGYREDSYGGSGGFYGERRRPYGGERRGPYGGDRRSPYGGERRGPYGGERRGPYGGGRGGSYGRGRVRSPYDSGYRRGSYRPY